MIRHLFHLTVATALIVAVGGHWAMLQSVAWVNMVVSYSQQAPLREAISMTFDGEHPCKLCVAVKQGKHEEKKQSVLKVETKLDFLCLAQFSYTPPVLSFTLLTAGSDAASPRADPPPLTPPRFA